MLFRSMVTCAALLAAGLTAGCADQQSLFASSNLTTASVAPQAPKADPACTSLGTQISTLRGEGIADKIERAAAKKYKMTTADLAKADQLTKVSAEFETKCGTVQIPAPVQAVAPPAAPAAKPAKTASAAPAKAAEAAAPKAQ
jgi:hypothetical protein